MEQCFKDIYTDWIFFFLSRNINPLSLFLSLFSNIYIYIANSRINKEKRGDNIPADVGVTGFEIGVVGFSRSSIFLAEGVLALLLVPLLGDGGGTSFFTWLLKGTEEGPSLSSPFSLGDAVPFAVGLVGPSLASSTTKSWSLFSPSLCYRGKRARLY